MTEKQYIDYRNAQADYNQKIVAQEKAWRDKGGKRTRRRKSRRKRKTARKPTFISNTH